MIYELYMKNCALVEELRVNFGKQLNILTGETGSGKSIILEAINLCLGGKFDRNFIRKGSDFCEVEALVFSSNKSFLEELKALDIEVDGDDSIIISRKLFLDGKSVNKVNGKNIRVGDLKNLMSIISDMHGQHQNQALYSVENHITFVDLFGKEFVENPLKEYQKVFDEYNSIKREINKLNDNKSEMEIQREKDLLNFQINEITSANINEEEYKDLVVRKDVFVNSEKIYNALNEAYVFLHSGEYNSEDFLGNASNRVSTVSKYDEKIEEMGSSLERIVYELEDITSTMRNYIEGMEFEPYILEEIQVRLDIYNTLKKKYGNSVSDIFMYLEKISNRLDTIENRDEKLNELKARLLEKEEELKGVSETLTDARKKAANQLEKMLLNELNTLNMKNTKFKVNFNKVEYNEGGSDYIEFFVSFNLGEDLKPLNKVASGGEMSRFMLAFKSILSEIDHIESLIFDEIDSGISGRAAQIVGEKLSFISKNKQVICVTHLPQIASFADEHYMIEKNIQNERTFTRIVELDEISKINEIARLISGKTISDKTIKHAEEILENTKSIKEDRFKKV